MPEKPVFVSLKRTPVVCRSVHRPYKYLLLSNWPMHRFIDDTESFLPRVE